MQITFEAVAESSPGPKWQALFNKNWPDYKAWFLSRRNVDAPSLSTSVEQLRRFMPELVPTYERLVELAGGDELAARFLSFYRPPVYLSGCSQAVWSGPGEVALIRNYDLDPALNEGVILQTQWNGRKVIAANECLWGVNDGINDAGLAVSVTFGGRQAVGDGFGIPLILRYVLEYCETTVDAIEVLTRVPSHMPYNVTVLDRQGDYATAQLSPDRPTNVTRQPVTTNHQGPIEWSEHARFTRTLERERFLTEHLAENRTTDKMLIEAFLQAPLFNRNYKNGFGTLYTAVYRPGTGEVELHWPDGAWVQSFDCFQEGTRIIRYFESPETACQPAARSAERPSNDTIWGDTAWVSDNSDVSELLKQVFTNVLDTLVTTGTPVPSGLREELLREMDSSGHVPWEKLGTIWTGEGVKY